MNPRVVSFHYTLSDSKGKVLDSSNGHQAFSYIEGTGQIIPGLEKQLAVLNKGDKRKIEVPAGEAYGLRNEAMVIRVPRQELPAKEVKMGDRFRGGEEPGSPVFTVTQLTENEITLDGNHALAGVDLTFDVELINIREATNDEISHGHAHGEHGHAH